MKKEITNSEISDYLKNISSNNSIYYYPVINEKKISSQIIETIKKNKIVSLISDAGTPTISDPGMILVNKCIEQNIMVSPIPGCSAVTSALSVSGFSDIYLFHGFLTKKENELEKILKSLSAFNNSIIFFVTAKSINFYIQRFKKYFFDRRILIAREITKIHEEFIRGNVVSINKLPDNIKGELTIIVSEKKEEKKNIKEITESVKIEIIKMMKKYSLKDVVEFISKKENLSKKKVYNFCLKLK